MRSAFRMVLRRWATTMVVLPWEARSSAAWTMRSPCTSMAEVASSRIRILGREMMLRAMAMRWRWPPVVM